MGQLKYLLQPIFFGLAPTYDCSRTFATYDYAANGNHNHVDQKMPPVARMPRVGQ